MAQFLEHTNLLRDTSIEQVSTIQRNTKTILDHAEIDWRSRENDNKGRLPNKSEKQKCKNRQHESSIVLIENWYEQITK